MNRHPSSLNVERVGRSEVIPFRSQGEKNEKIGGMRVPGGFAIPNSTQRVRNREVPDFWTVFCLFPPMSPVFPRPHGLRMMDSAIRTAIGARSLPATKNSR